MFTVRKWLAVAMLTLSIGIPTFLQTGGAHAATILPHRIACYPGYVYDNVTRQGENDYNIGPHYKNWNDSPWSATDTFTSTVTGTITVTVSASVTVDASVIVAGVDATAGVSVATAVSYSQSTSQSLYVPAYWYGNGQFVMRREKAVGHYYYLTNYCTVGADYGYVTSYSPYSPGWNTWSTSS